MLFLISIIELSTKSFISYLLDYDFFLFLILLNVHFFDSIYILFHFPVYIPWNRFI